MENSAKALEIAAVILITVILLSLASYLFISTGISSSRFYDKINENQTNEFNAKFLKYDRLETCTTHDIVTVINLAKDNNKKYELTEQDAGINTYYITVKVIEKDGSTYEHAELWNEESLFNFLSSNFENVGSGSDLHKQPKNYKCEVSVSESTKRVYHIKFTGI